MNVSLPETMKEFGRQKVAIGNNESASEVVGAAVARRRFKTRSGRGRRRFGGQRR
jgi:Arc/MetJ-type ribon-helix-helix transcriptional regulator